MRRQPKRKTRKAEVQIPFPKLLANVLVLVAVLGICYVGLCARCDQLGAEIKRLEKARKVARLQVINEQDRWSNLLAPANFERALRHHHLAMSLPDDRRIVRVRQKGRVAGRTVLAYRQGGSYGS
jgi:hypothetical protein